MTFKTIGVEIDDKIYQRAETKAANQGKTINRIIVESLYTYVGEEAPQPEPPPASPTPEPEQPSAPKVTIYVVQSGDTLGAIAKKMYGSPTKYYIIQKANNLSDPGRIWVGQKLVIPVREEETLPTTTTPTTPPVSAPSSSSGGTDSAPTVVVTPPPVEEAALKNPRPEIRFVGSPNFNRRPNGEISAVVMHATANGSLQRVIEWFNNPSAMVSAHYTIGKDGTIVQHVRDEHRAWHAGKSEWKGRKDLNSWALGVEMVNWNNGEDPFPEPQHQAAVDLVSHLCEKYDIKPEFIVAHYDVSPGRKTDPKGYDMDRLRREVKARLP